jgi:hypothetical protein
MKHKIPKSQTLQLAAASGDISGEVNLIWEPVSGANTYVIQKSTNINKPGNWKHEDVVTSPSCTATELKSGRVYWFRVAAVGPWGRGSWSKAVHKKAP